MLAWTHLWNASWAKTRLIKWWKNSCIELINFGLDLALNSTKIDQNHFKKGTISILLSTRNIKITGIFMVTRRKSCQVLQLGGGLATIGSFRGFPKFQILTSSMLKVAKFGYKITKSAGLAPLMLPLSNDWTQPSSLISFMWFHQISKDGS